MGATSILFAAALTLVACNKDTTSGVWDTNYGGDTTLTLKSEGNQKVSGTYTGQTHNGTFTGTMTGSTLSGHWDEGTAKGSVTFTFSHDGNAFTGLYQSDDKKKAGSWDGHKRGTARDASIGDATPVK